MRGPVSRRRGRAAPALYARPAPALCALPAGWAAAGAPLHRRRLQAGSVGTDATAGGASSTPTDDGDSGDAGRETVQQVGPSQLMLWLFMILCRYYKNDMGFIDMCGCHALHLQLLCNLHLFTVKFGGIARNSAIVQTISTIRTVHGSMETVHPFQRRETPYRHCADNFSGYMVQFQHNHNLRRSSYNFGDTKAI